MPPKTQDLPKFALYLSSVEGVVVPRYGVNGVYIGARRATGDEKSNRATPGIGSGPKGWVWTKDVVGITAAELAAYKREYEDHIARKELEVRKASDFEAQLTAEAAQQEAEAKARAEAANTPPTANTSTSES